MDNRVRDIGKVNHDSIFTKEFLYPYGYASLPLREYFRVLSKENCEFFHNPHMALKQTTDTVVHNMDEVNDIDDLAKQCKRFQKRINGKVIAACTSLASGTLGSDKSLSKSFEVLSFFLTEDDDFLDNFLVKAHCLTASIYLISTWLYVGRTLFRNPNI